MWFAMRTDKVSKKIQMSNARINRGCKTYKVTALKKRQKVQR